MHLKFSTRQYKLFEFSQFHRLSTILKTLTPLNKVQMEQKPVSTDTRGKAHNEISEEKQAHLLLKMGRYGTLLMWTHDTAAGWQVTGPKLIGRGYSRVAEVIRLLVR